MDGVAPSKKTFADGTYPLLGINYAVFHKDEPADSNVRQLVDWMVSFDGQTAIAKAGYVTVMDIGFDYQEMTFKKYPHNEEFFEDLTAELYERLENK